MDAPERLTKLKSADALARAGKFDEAAAACDAVLAAHAEDPTANNLKGVCLAGAGKSKEAIPYFLAARKGAPDDASIRFNLAQAYIDAEVYNKALEEYDKILELTPEDPMARLARGALRRNAGDERGARKDLEEAVRLDKSLETVVDELIRAPKPERKA